MRESQATDNGPVNPVKLLSAWMALEVLSPQSFRRREELAGPKRTVLDFEGGPLPWLDDSVSEPGSTTFYQVVLGTVAMEEAFRRLIEEYEDRRPERPPMHGEAILALVTLDASGVPLHGTGLAVSSFAWGLPLALKRDLGRLGAWSDERKTLLERLGRELRGADRKPVPLDAARLEKVFHRLVGWLRLDPSLVHPPAFCVRIFSNRSSRGNEKPRPPDPPLLDSFFLDDLRTARDRFEQGLSMPTLEQYVGTSTSAAQLPLGGRSPACFATARRFTQPAAFPPARWRPGGAAIRSC